MGLRRLMDLFYPLMERGLHRSARQIAAEPPSASGFAGLDGCRQALVVSYKRDGEPVPTVVNCGFAGGKLYFRTEPRTAKVARIRRDPRVLVGPCDLRGKPRQGLAEGRARLLPAGEGEPAEEAVRSNWSALMRPSERAIDRFGLELVYVEVEPAG